MAWDLLSSTRSLTGKLAIFFTSISLVVGVVTSLIFIAALDWSEDRVIERRILIDRNAAIERYLAGAEGRIEIDALTVAYNSLDLVPDPYRSYLSEHDSFLSEVDFSLKSLSRLIYKGYFFEQGQRRDIILLSQVDEVELDSSELLYSGTIIVALVASLMLLFGGLLYRLSKRLIEPVNEIVLQLKQQSGDAERSFSINKDAANEFQLLTDRLNQYRSELNLVLKREQAFARYVSHELRTPMTVIKGASKLLLRSDHCSFQERQIHRIDNATTQVSTMIDALLALVRYERNVDDAPLRTVSESEVRSIVSNNTVQSHAKEVTIALVIDSLPTVRATQPVLSMIVGNLLRNAISATVKGNIDLKVSSSELTLIDDGPGLSKQPDQFGHGLGLLIVDDLCRRYGWQFELTNCDNRGCIARIDFASNGGREPSSG